MEQSEREARDRPTIQSCGELCTQRRTLQTVHGKTSQGKALPKDVLVISLYWAAYTHLWRCASNILAVSDAVSCLV